MHRVSALLLAAAFAAPWSAAATPAPGWAAFPVGATGEYYLRYLPPGLDLSRPVPLVVFLHGAGSLPETYSTRVQVGADAAGAVVVMPRAESYGWGAANDPTTIAESVRLVRQEIAIDPQRIAIAGHSAGGAYAYLLAYGTLSRYSAVFSMSAPFYSLSALADDAYSAPLRLYYGTTDPNYQGGSAAAVAQQFTALGVVVTQDIEPGYGHSTWPDGSIEDGFRFLIAARYPGYSSTCSPTPHALCLANGRFRAEATWQQVSGGGQAFSGPPLPSTSGLFWFFSPSNLEMLVKVLDGCGVNGHFWVFAAATTNLGTTLTVTDTTNAAQRQYSNPTGRAAPTLADTSAFACP